MTDLTSKLKYLFQTYLEGKFDDIFDHVEPVFVDLYTLGEVIVYINDNILLL
jgi:hypothetical protein